MISTSRRKRWGSAEKEPTVKNAPATAGFIQRHTEALGHACDKIVWTASGSAFERIRRLDEDTPHAPIEINTMLGFLKATIFIRQKCSMNTEKVYGRLENHGFGLAFVSLAQSRVLIMEASKDWC